MIGNAALVVLLGITWGLNWPAVRLALDGFPPFTFRALGFSSAAIVMFATIWIRGLSPVVPRAHWWRLLLVGTFTVVAYNLFSAFAQLSASTARSAVLSYTMPVWTVLFARFYLGERLDRPRIIGLVLGIAGLVSLGEPLIAAGTFSIGLVYAIMSGVVWAMGNVALKRYPIGAPPFIVTAWQIALGAVITVVLALAIDGVPTHLTGNRTAWAALAYNVFIGQALGTTLWFTILAKLPAGIAAIGSLLVPGIGVIGATLILGEHPTVPDWIGLVLIVAASAAVLLRRPASTVPTPPPPMVPVPNRSN